MKRTALLLVLLALLPGVFLGAQEPARPAATQEDFVPVGSLPPQAEQLPAAPLVIGAYAFVWLALLVYVWSLWRRMTKLERELADLQRRVQKQQ
jgi:CcmD family protein